MEPISRRKFLLSTLSSVAVLTTDGLPSGLLSHALAAEGKYEGAANSGDIYFNHMHTELLGKKRDGKKRAYPSKASGEKIGVLIVGGGIAGLDAAYYLLTSPNFRKRGASVRVFEMDDEPGGTAKKYGAGWGHRLGSGLEISVYWDHIRRYRPFSQTICPWLRASSRCLPIMTFSLNSKNSFGWRGFP